MTPCANWWWYGPDDAAAAAAAVAAAIASVAAMSSAGGGGGGCGGGITILRSGFIRSRTRATMTRPIPAHQMVDHPKRPIFFFFFGGGGGGGGEARSWGRKKNEQTMEKNNVDCVVSENERPAPGFFLVSLRNGDDSRDVKDDSLSEKKTGTRKGQESVAVRKQG